MRILLLSFLSGVLILFAGHIYADDVPTFTDGDLEKYGGPSGSQREQTDKIKRPARVAAPTPETEDHEKDKLTSNDAGELSTQLKEEIDREVKSIWQAMKISLVNKNIDKAIEYYHDETKQKYRDMYSAFGDKLPQLARELEDIQPIYIKENEAKYRLISKESYGGKVVDITYPVYFVKDSNGSWKILQY